jgi:hypothetical protein
MIYIFLVIFSGLLSQYVLIDADMTGKSNLEFYSALILLALVLICMTTEIIGKL